MKRRRFWTGIGFAVFMGTLLGGLTAYFLVPLIDLLIR